MHATSTRLRDAVFAAFVEAGYSPAPPADHTPTKKSWLWARTNCDSCFGDGETLFFVPPFEPVDADESAIARRTPCDCLWSPPGHVIHLLDAVLARLGALGDDVAARGAGPVDPVTAARQQVLAEIGPRVPGSGYLDGLMQRWLRVERISITAVGGDPTHLVWALLVRTATGRLERVTRRWAPELGDRMPHEADGHVVMEQFDPWHRRAGRRITHLWRRDRGSMR
jgi:hypothetical protein